MKTQIPYKLFLRHLIGQTISLAHSKQSPCNIIFDNSKLLLSQTVFVFNPNNHFVQFQLQSQRRSMLINILNEFEFKQGMIFQHLYLQSLRKFKKIFFYIF